MFWHTPNEGGLHGVQISRFAGQFHLFTTHAPRGTFDRTVLHAVSDDGVRWTRRSDFLGVGEKGAFDGWTLYDLQAIEHDGTYCLFYTGIDRPHGKDGGKGQRQAIGLVTSTDLVTWRRHSTQPVLEGSADYYEQFVPDEASYQAKDRGRQWFRDPWVYPLSGLAGVGGKFGMAVGARAAGVHPDVNGCFAWAFSDDLIHWRPQPPLYCPRRFHTMECPVVFDLAGRTYLIWLTHPEWGTPLLTTDPWQSAGVFYAFSDDGVHGPYKTPEDEILVGGAYTNAANGRRRGRGAVARTVVGLDDKPLVSYHLMTAPDPSDDISGASPQWAEFANAGSVIPLLKPLRARPDGDLELGLSDAMSACLDTPITPGAMPAERWRIDDGTWVGKHFSAQSVQWLDAGMGDGALTARIAITRGLRAGLLLRAAGDGQTGQRIVLDRNLGCIEWGVLDADAPLDRRRWLPRGGWTELSVIAHGPSIEIYCDGKLMLHQVRYREVAGRVGLVVDNAEARFANVQLRTLKPGTPLLTG